MAEEKVKEQYVDEMLIIGNGFDLACGLKSTYNDYFQDRYNDGVLQDFINKTLTLDDNKPDENFQKYNIFDYIILKNNLVDKSWAGIEETISYILNDNQSKNFAYTLNKILNIYSNVISNAGSCEDDITFFDKYTEFSENIDYNIVFFLVKLGILPPIKFFPFAEFENNYIDFKSEFIAYLQGPSFAMLPSSMPLDTSGIIPPDKQKILNSLKKSNTNISDLSLQEIFTDEISKKYNLFHKIKYPEFKNPNCSREEFNNIIQKHFHSAISETENNFDKYLSAYIESLPKIEDLCYIYNDESKSIPISTYVSKSLILFQILLSKDAKDLEKKYILSFNYTNPLKLGYSSDGIIAPSYFKYYNCIHGELEIYRNSDTDNTVPNIIFGIDENNINIEDENTLYNRKFTKTYKKLLYDSSSKIDKQNLSLPNSNNLKTIKFFGHSLSEADYSYFQSIFDFYDIYHSKIRLIFVYYDYDAQEHLSEEISKVFKMFETYGKTFTNTSHGKNLLHKLQVEDRLEVIELKDLAKRNGVQN